MSCTYLDRDLDAYVDRELAADADAAVRAHVQTCGRCDARVAERQALARLVRALPYYEAPARLRAGVVRTEARAHLARRLSTFAAAAVLVLAAGGGALMLSARNDRANATRIVDAHVAALTSGHVFDVRSTDQHTVKPWFQGKLDYSPPVSDLAAIGFPLVGGRLEAIDGHAVAALVYQRRQHVISLFVAPAGMVWWPRTGTYTVRGFHARQWTAGGMAFWAVSDLNQAELDELARALGAP